MCPSSTHTDTDFRDRLTSPGWSRRNQQKVSPSCGCKVAYVTPIANGLKIPNLCSLRFGFIAVYYLAVVYHLSLSLELEIDMDGSLSDLHDLHASHAAYERCLKPLRLTRRMSNVLE